MPRRGPANPPIRSIDRYLSRKLRWLELEESHKPSSSTKMKIAWALCVNTYIHLCPELYSICIHCNEKYFGKS
jgi:hypothetical protein